LLGSAGVWADVAADTTAATETAVTEAIEIAAMTDVAIATIAIGADGEATEGVVAGNADLISLISTS